MILIGQHTSNSILFTPNRWMACGYIARLQFPYHEQELQGYNRTSFIFMSLALGHKIFCGLCFFIVSSLVLWIVRVPANMIFSREPSFNYHRDWRLFDPEV
ncbi:hypothetical protein PHAVU_006G085611 [Phaseolus vulgaris]